MLKRSTISSMIRDIAETIDEAWPSTAHQSARRHTHGAALGADGTCISSCSDDGSCRVWQVSCIQGHLAKHEGAAEL
eukprot:jgi/Tetstr1/425311/TSEL_015761.t1